MSIEKFKNEANEIQAPNKKFRNKVDKIVEKSIENNDVERTTVGFNLFDMEKNKKSKKVSISIYFEEEDLKLLKAISKLKDTTVNKTVAKVLEDTIKITRANLPEGFDVAKMAKKYDLKNKDKGNKTGSNTDNNKEQNNASENNNEN